LQPTFLEPYEDLVQDLTTAEAIDLLVADLKRRIVSTPSINTPNRQRMEKREEDLLNQWKVTSRLLTYNRWIYIANNDLLCNKVLISFPWKSNIWQLRSSQIHQIGFPGFSLAHTGCQSKKINCLM
jgi:hypothetical protein